jgi:hypothetical protein
MFAISSRPSAGRRLIAAYPPLHWASPRDPARIFKTCEHSIDSIDSSDSNSLAVSFFLRKRLGLPKAKKALSLRIDKIVEA